MTTARRGPDDDVEIASPESTRAFTKNINAFGLDLYRDVGRGRGNRVISPVSIALGLALLREGAQNETRRELSDVLRLHQAEDVQGSVAALLARWHLPPGPETEAQPRWVTERYQLTVANRLFADEDMSLSGAFEDIAAGAYAAPVDRVDFQGNPNASRDAINAWAERETHGRIRELLPASAVGPSTRLVLANGVYFKGEWAALISEEDTRPAPFHAPSGIKDVPTMHVAATFDFAKYPDDGVSVLAMPFATPDDPMMVFILPDRRDGLSDVETALDEPRLARWIDGLAHQKVEVALPKFTLESTRSWKLDGALRSLGLHNLWNAASDFSGICDRSIALTGVYQRAFVKVDEKGAEAAAATGEEMVERGGRGVEPEPEQFEADHPFLFLVVDPPNRAVIFIGRVEDPTDSSADIPEQSAR